ncbi:hypothetical protein M8818_005379 [Zalaria obscura]|uniref:Uncharacterized protein n=1 Tax=Zalaria obscura TaxID=2024903 RepID=A0ACC3S948_9PEZI
MNPLFYQVETFSHPELGDIKGRVFRQDEANDIVHFRSIPYATIPGRFKPCALLENIPSTFDHRPKGDFTEYGNACPSVHQPDSAYGGPLPGQTPRTYDEQTCLNLTISAPRSAVLAGQRNHGLPVMVYVHGGAFKEGAGHISALHDTTHMVGLSATENRPVIIVNIGYRLNWFGFMNCRDLIDEHVESSDEAYPFNLGIHDQRTAFQWIHKHIGGFGGNASNITAFGESAGSGSIAIHLASDLPLFKRAIMMSGNFGIMRSATLASHDESYWALLDYLNMDFETREERLEALRAVPASKLVEAINALPHVSFSPYLGPDNEMFTRGIPSYSTQDSIISSCRDGNNNRPA